MDEFGKMVNSLSEGDGITEEDCASVMEYFKNNPSKVEIELNHTGVVIRSTSPMPVAVSTVARGFAKLIAEDIRTLPKYMHESYLDATVAKLFGGFLDDCIADVAEGEHVEMAVVKRSLVEN